MGELKFRLIKEAKEKYKNIYPCSFRESLEDCFTVIGNKYVFWFNTDDNSTRVMTSELLAAE